MCFRDSINVFVCVHQTRGWSSYLFILLWTHLSVCLFVFNRFFPHFLLSYFKVEGNRSSTITVMQTRALKSVCPRIYIQCEADVGKFVFRMMTRERAGRYRDAAQRTHTHWYNQWCLSHTHTHTKKNNNTCLLAENDTGQKLLTFFLIVV